MKSVPVLFQDDVQFRLLDVKLPPDLVNNTGR